MRIARATSHHLDAVLGLIEDATQWLGTKRTDQWRRPWPDWATRDARVLRGLENRKSWIVWDDDVPAATVTMATRANPAVWSSLGCVCDRSERAVYVHRLITARKYAHRGLGSQLIDWAGLYASRAYGAKWIRIDVWTSNTGLHEYYESKGFKRCGTCADPQYPSGALFQKPVAEIREPRTPELFRRCLLTSQVNDQPENIPAIGLLIAWKGARIKPFRPGVTASRSGSASQLSRG